MAILASSYVGKPIFSAFSSAMSTFYTNVPDGPSTYTSACPWKGTANYYTLKVNNERNVNAVWFYAEPKDAAKQIKGRVAFWKGVGVVG
jgi:Domain of unknown function (DUF427)